MLEKYLQEIGLSEKEASVYIALLAFDKAPVADISKKAKVKRPTTYNILVSLANKGLVSEVVVGKKTLYIAEPPERLESYISRQVFLLEENKKSLNKVIPQLKSLQREEGEKPVVQFFEGKEGIISTTKDLFEEKFENEKVYIIYSNDLIASHFDQKELKIMRDKRLSLGIKSKAVYTSKDSEKLSDNTGERVRIDNDKYPINCDITIYGDKVKMSILGKRLSGVSIKSPEIANTLKSLINYIFDHHK